MAEPAAIQEDIPEFVADLQAAIQDLYSRLEAVWPAREDSQNEPELQLTQQEEADSNQSTFVPPIIHFELGGHDPPGSIHRQAHDEELQDLRQNLRHATDDQLFALQSMLSHELGRRHSINSFGSDTDSQLGIPRLHDIETVNDGGTPLLPDPEFDPWFEAFLYSLPTDASGSQLTQSDFQPVASWNLLEAEERLNRFPAMLTNQRRRTWQRWWPWTLRGFYTVVYDGVLVAFVRMVEDEEGHRTWKKGWRSVYQITTLAAVGLFQLPIIGPHWIYG